MKGVRENVRDQRLSGVLFLAVLNDAPRRNLVHPLNARVNNMDDGLYLSDFLGDLL